MKRNWLQEILDDVDRRCAGKPEWERSEYAQMEIARLRAEAAEARGLVACRCGDGSCMLCDDNGMVPRDFLDRDLFAFAEDPFGEGE